MAEKGDEKALITTDDQRYTVVIHYRKEQFEYCCPPNTDSWNNDTYLELSQTVSKQYDLTNEFGLYEDMHGLEWVDIDDHDDLRNAFQDLIEENEDNPAKPLHLYVKDHELMDLVHQKNEIMKFMMKEIETLQNEPRQYVSAAVVLKVLNDKQQLLDDINEKICNLQIVHVKNDEEFSDDNDICLDDINQNQIKTFTFHLVGFGIHNPSNCPSIVIMENVSGVSLQTALHKDSTIGELRALIHETFNIPRIYSDGTDLLILYSHCVLNEEFTDDKPLHEVGIVNDSCLLVIVKDKEGKDTKNTQLMSSQLSIKDMFATESTNTSEEKKDGDSDDQKNEEQEMNIGQILQMLQIERTLSLDIITQEQNVEVFKMPGCGHSMTPTSLYDYALSRCFNKSCKVLQCAHYKCDTVWQYPIIKQYLLSGAFVCSKLEVLLSRNVLLNNETYSVQKCIHCNVLLYRLKSRKMNETKFETKCIICEKEFCWSCNEEWKSNHSCDASFRFQVVEILSKCELKTIGSQENIPSVRACPKCSALIYHVDACKHMKCGECKTDFCFVCLLPKNNDNWQCGSHSDPCPNGVHQRQDNKDLPPLTYTKQCELF
eukprot:170941_1